MRIEAKNLIKIYGDRSVVNDVSFEVNKGEVVGLLGPNGAGKSSLLLALACLLKRESGTISFQGEPVLERVETAYRRRIAMVFQ